MTKRSILKSLVLLMVSAFLLGALCFVNIHSRASAETLSGKKLLYDYDAEEWNSLYATVDTTENAYPYGKMLSLNVTNQNNAYISYAKEYALNNLTDWTGAKYVIFYVENTATTQQGVRIILNSLDPDYANAQQFIVNPANSAGVVYLDNFTENSAATVSASTNNFIIPAQFKGYVKVAVSDSSNFKALLTGDARTPSLYLGDVQQINFRGSQSIRVDTTILSYDDDITSVLSEKDVLCGRSVSGENELTAIRNLYSDNTGYAYWDGPQSMMSSYITYDEYYTKMTFNAPISKIDATKSISPREKFLEYTLQNDWSKAKYFVMEIQNHATTVSQVYPKFVAYVDDARTVFMKEGKLPMFLKNKSDGSITYLSARETFNGRPLIQIPAGFDGYAVVPFEDFAEGVNNDLIPGGKRLKDYADNISTFNLQVTWYNYAQNFTVGTVGYAQNDLIKTDTSLPKIVNEGVVETVSLENTVTPIVGFVNHKVCNDEIASYSDGKFIINGSLATDGMITVNGLKELDKVDLINQNFVIFDLKNNSASEAKILFKIYTEGADLYKLPYGTRVFAVDGSGSYIMTGAETYLSIPAEFEGKIIVPFCSLVGQNGNEEVFDKTKITGFGFAMPKAVETNLEFTVPYFAQSIKAWKENASVVKLEQDEIAFENDTEVILGDTVTLAAVGGNTGGTVVYSIIEGQDFATLDGNGLFFVKAGNVTVRATKPGNEYYLDTVKETVFNISKKTPVIRNVSETVNLSGNITVVGDTDSDGDITVEYYINGEWKTSVPDTAGEYRVKISVSETDEYKPSEKEITLYIVNKYIPVIETEPTVSAVYYGDTLTDDLIANGTAKYNGQNVEGTFTFKQSITLDVVGEKEIYIVFTPTDVQTYSSVDIALKINVLKAKLKVTPDSLTCVYGEEEKALTYTVTGFKFDDETVLSGNLEREAGENAGRYLINSGTLTAGNCYEIELAEVYYVIEKAIPIVEVDEFSSFVYEHTDASKLKFTDFTASVAGKIVLEEKILSVGENTVSYTFIPEDAVNYKTVEGVLTITAHEVKVSRLEIKNLPDKTVYTKGEELDLTGLTITVKFNNGGQTEIGKEDVTVSGYSGNAEGKQTVTLTYREKTVDIEIEVKSVEVIFAKPGCKSNLNTDYIAAVCVFIALVVFAKKKRNA